ncbi:hypothetical protein P8452_04615 [Trifolium repens]|nr:hypothetical protein P8452_04615 [Trifolium repens]
MSGKLLIRTDILTIFQLNPGNAIATTEKSESIIGVESSKSIPLEIALDDIVMELSSTSEHDHNQLTKITPSKRPPVKEHDDEKLLGQLSSNKPVKMKLRNVKHEKARL